jgi:hypothetical protein
MLIHLKTIPGDDASFLNGFCGFASETVRQLRPREVFVIRIDNWFDVKWFGFAGKTKVAFDSGLPSINSEVQAFWKTRGDVTFPPFVPNRVLEQVHYRYEDGSLTRFGDDARHVYSGEKQLSGKNLQNRVLDFSSSAIYFWFSSKSKVNGRASMMCYRAHQGVLSAWYVSFVRDKVWRVDRSRNMDKDVIKRHFQAGVAEGKQ